MLGIYGGTFNPVHYGHLRTAIEVKEAFALESVRMLPCYQPPHRHQPTVSAKMRQQMLELAIAHQPDLICDSRELEREGYSYMVDTLATLKQDFPKESLLLFMGTDAFGGLSSWHQWQDLFKLAHIVVMTRPNSINPCLSEFLKTRLCDSKATLNHHEAGKLFFQSVTQLDISATLIRTRQAQGKSLRFLLPDNVIDYIEQHQLYRNLNAN